MRSAFIPLRNTCFSRHCLTSYVTCQLLISVISKHFIFMESHRSVSHNSTSFQAHSHVGWTNWTSLLLLIHITMWDCQLLLEPMCRQDFVFNFLYTVLCIMITLIAGIQLICLHSTNLIWWLVTSQWTSIQRFILGTPTFAIGVIGGWFVCMTSLWIHTIIPECFPPYVLQHMTNLQPHSTT